MFPFDHLTYFMYFLSIHLFIHFIFSLIFTIILGTTASKSNHRVCDAVNSEKDQAEAKVPVFPDKAGAKIPVLSEVMAIPCFNNTNHTLYIIHFIHRCKQHMNLLASSTLFKAPV